MTLEALSLGLSPDRILGQGPCVECQVPLQNIIVNISGPDYTFGKREPLSGKLPNDKEQRLICRAVPRPILPTAGQILTSLGNYLADAIVMKI